MGGTRSLLAFWAGGAANAHPGGFHPPHPLGIGKPAAPRGGFRLPLPIGSGQIAPAQAPEGGAHVGFGAWIPAGAPWRLPLTWIERGALVAAAADASTARFESAETGQIVLAWDASAARLSPGGGPSAREIAVLIALGVL